MSISTLTPTGLVVISMQDKPITPILMFLGVIFFTLCVIIAGYFHGHMNIGAVWHNLHNFN